MKSDRNMAYITFVSDVSCCTFPKELPQNLESKGNDFVEVAVTELIGNVDIFVLNLERS